MHDRAERRAFAVLHLTLALVVLVHGVHALVHASEALLAHHHLALLGTLEIVAVGLFLWPRTVRIGGWLLLAVFATGAVVDAVNGVFPSSELVYAAATFFVTIHGSAWRHQRSQLGAA